MIKSNDYWKKREAAEKEWQKQAEKNMQAYNQHIAQMYQNAIDEINRQIKSDLGFADNKLITAKDMQEYETLAKEAVKKANALRAEGHYVTRKDFSKDVNDRLKVYNATMRINRNEILKSKIGARLVELGVEQETDLTKKLWNDYIKEKERQAGILGITTKSDLWTSKEVQGQIYKQIANANFSKRIWADIDGLKGTLDGLVSTAIIRGDNPKSMAKWLTGMVSAAVGNQRYVAERLARTETARVQFEAQQKSILDAGYKYVKWMAEGSACKLCREIAYKDNGYDEDGVYKAKDVPDIPVHPNCMCSISAYWVDDDKKNAEKDKDVVENEYSNLKLSDFADDINLKGLKQDSIDVITDAFNAINQKVSLPHLDSIQAITERSKIGKMVFPNGGVASFSNYGNNLYINSSQFKSLKKLNKVISEEKQAEKTLLDSKKELSDPERKIISLLKVSKRTNVDPNPQGIITHELGHAIQYNDFVKNATEEEKTYANGDWIKDAARISYYATTSPMEYFAEAFVAYLKGEMNLINPKLLKYFKSIKK